MAGESLALRALVGLSDTTLNGADEAPLQLPHSLGFLSKAALCSWWHAKISKSTRGVLMFTVRERQLVSQALAL